VRNSDKILYRMKCTDLLYAKASIDLDDIAALSSHETKQTPHLE